MRRTEQARGSKRFTRTRRGVLGQAEAAEILGVSDRAPSGAGGAVALRRTARRVSTTAAWAASRHVARRWTKWRGCLSWFDTRYWDFTAKHFHEKLVAEHGSKRSYNWVRLTLQAYGLQASGAQAWGAPAQAPPSRASRHDGAPGRLAP